MVPAYEYPWRRAQQWLHWLEEIYGPGVLPESPRAAGARLLPGRTGAFAVMLVGPDGMLRLASANAGEFAHGLSQPLEPRFVHVFDESAATPRYFLLYSVPTDAVAGARTRLRGIIDEPNLCHFVHATSQAKSTI